MPIYIYDQLGNTLLCHKIQRKALSMFLSSFVSCHHPCCTAESNYDELALPIVQKKHT